VAQVKGRVPVKFTIVLPAQASWANLPVVIYQHGINRTRNQVLVVADTAMKLGVAVIAIDLPFHGDRVKTRGMCATT